MELNSYCRGLIWSPSQNRCHLRKGLRSSLSCHSNWQKGSRWDQSHHRSAALKVFTQQFQYGLCFNTFITTLRKHPSMSENPNFQAFCRSIFPSLCSRSNLTLDSNRFFNTPIMVRMQILVHSWVPRTKISALFHRCYYLGLDYVCCAGYFFLALFWTSGCPCGLVIYCAY